MVSCLSATRQEGAGAPRMLSESGCTSMRQFSKTIHRYHALRRAGVDTRNMVRAAGIPAIMYGCETIGLSDSALSVVRASVARAAAPQAWGKNPDATLYGMSLTAQVGLWTQRSKRMLVPSGTGPLPGGNAGYSMSLWYRPFAWLLWSWGRAKLRRGRR